jgi:predicted DNA-binding transcriptional regulator AlpA
MSDKLITRREAALALSMAPQTLAKWAMVGKHLPTVKLGRTVRYRESDVRRLIDTAPAK